MGRKWAYRRIGNWFTLKGGQLYFTSKVKQSQFSLQKADKQITYTSISEQIYLTKMKISSKISPQQTVAKSSMHYNFGPIDLKIKLFSNCLIPSIHFTIIILVPKIFQLFLSVSMNSKSWVATVKIETNKGKKKLFQVCQSFANLNLSQLLFVWKCLCVCMCVCMCVLETTKKITKQNNNVKTKV